MLTNFFCRRSLLFLIINKMIKFVPIPILLVLLSWSLPVHSASEIRCLADVIYFEARGEDRAGMQAVGEVVLNRVKDSRYPDNVCDVVYQPYQFSWTATQYRVTNWGTYNKVYRMAMNMLKGEYKPVVGKATHFHRSSKSKTRWHTSSNMRKVAQIHSHVFYYEHP